MAHTKHHMSGKLKRPASKVTPIENDHSSKEPKAPPKKKA